MSDEPKTKLYLVGPHGKIMTRVLTYCPGDSADIDSIDDNGWVDDFSHSDFPVMDMLGMNDSQLLHISDGDGPEFLHHHCRLMRGPSDYDHWGGEPTGIEPWPDEIIAACARAEHVAWALTRAQEFKQSLPPGYDDTTYGVVMETIVLGRLSEELAALEQQIGAFRKGRAEATSFLLDDEDDDEDDAEERTDAEA